MSQYYTPELKEFHVGFEFEYEVVKGISKWEEAKVKPHHHIDVLRTNIEEGLFRVKYLDLSDIESLGFELIESKKSNYFGDLFSVTKSCRLGSLDSTTYRLLLGQGNKVQLTLIEDNSYGGNTQEMNLTIKNKSELVKVLEMIGYE